MKFNTYARLPRTLQKLIGAYAPDSVVGGDIPGIQTDHGSTDAELRTIWRQMAKDTTTADLNFKIRYVAFFLPTATSEVASGLAMMNTVAAEELLDRGVTRADLAPGWKQMATGMSTEDLKTSCIGLRCAILQEDRDVARLFTIMYVELALELKRRGFSEDEILGLDRPSGANPAQGTPSFDPEQVPPESRRMGDLTDDELIVIWDKKVSTETTAQLIEGISGHTRTLVGLTGNNKRWVELLHDVMAEELKRRGFSDDDIRGLL